MEPFYNLHTHKNEFLSESSDNEETCFIFVLVYVTNLVFFCMFNHFKYFIKEMAVFFFYR